MKRLLLVAMVCAVTGAQGADTIIKNNLGKGWKATINTPKGSVTITNGSSTTLKDTLPVAYTVSGIKINGPETSSGAISGTLTTAGNYVINLGARGRTQTIQNPDQSKDDMYKTSYAIAVVAVE